MAHSPAIDGRIRFKIFYALLIISSHNQEEKEKNNHDCQCIARKFTSSSKVQKGKIEKYFMDNNEKKSSQIFRELIKMSCNLGGLDRA